MRLWWAHLLLGTTAALYAEDAGTLDVLIATAGHGPVAGAKGTRDAVVTWGTKYVTSRSVATGHVLGRIACDHPCRVAVVGSVVVTTDGRTVRGWTATDGSLLWDRATTTKVKDVYGKDELVVVVTEDHPHTVLHALTGEEALEVSPKSVAKPAPSNPTSVRCEGLTVGVEHGELMANADKLEVEADAVYFLSCENGTFTVLATSERGTTSQVRLTASGGRITWTAQEGLAHISSALMLDASHEMVKADTQSDILQLSSRLQDQWNGFVSLFTPSESRLERRNHIFGFVKIAVLLSDSAKRVFGMATVGEKRGKIRYQIDLTPDADWHRMVHGSTNSDKAAHGVNGGAHTRDILIVSSKQTSLDWICIEGTSGEVHGKGTVDISSPVVQIMPLASKGDCHQGAMLLLEDQSLVPVGDVTLAETAPMYTHVLNKENAGLVSYGISNTNEKLQSHLVGSASFPGERIVSVAYPSRDEVYQSPCSVLGDNSLLLKYLNPHLAVVVTMRTSLDDEDEFPLKPQRKLKKGKPIGATPQDVKGKDKPNLFVNLIDTVSGRVFYRASHTNAVLPSESPAVGAVSVLVSENWVFYTFLNSKTKKAELGVLSLHEGMIDKAGLTAFTTPEQSTTFSSLDARETKPVVLAKTFVLPKAVTALGMTATRSGISGRRLLLAGMDGQIHSIDRKTLEPRRPLGPLKDSEKKEGLVQYHELIQTIPFLCLSYNQTVESVTSIVTAPTDLESQSLVLAFGGPDVFFTRTSPSRGFDLLPDTFNRVLLAIVVAVLIGAYLTLKTMVAKKIKTQGWV